MKLKALMNWVGFLSAVLLTAQVHAEETQALRTQQDKVSYGIGVEMADNLKRQGIEVDFGKNPKPQWNEVNLDLVIKGLKDQLSGEKLLMPERELRRNLIMFQSELRRKQVQTRTVGSEVNKQEGEAFLQENKKKEGVVTLPSGLQYKILKAGDGRKPTDTDTVEVIYRGTLINGTEFDSSKPGQPTVLKITGLIPGLKEALKLMPVGSKWQIFVPTQLAYGPRGKGREIGPNETLIYELELLSIK
jgi:FKBP-type peptidyl-prolyl cis-trans isomerase